MRRFSINSTRVFDGQRIINQHRLTGRGGERRLKNLWEIIDIIERLEKWVWWRPYVPLFSLWHCNYWCKHSCRTNLFFFTILRVHFIWGSVTTAEVDRFARGDRWLSIKNVRLSPRFFFWPLHHDSKSRTFALNASASPVKCLSTFLSASTKHAGKRKWTNVCQFSSRSIA